MRTYMISLGIQGLLEAHISLIFLNMLYLDLAYINSTCLFSSFVSPTLRTSQSDTHDIYFTEYIYRKRERERERERESAYVFSAFVSPT
jgi:hypothetical protein